MVNRLGGNAAPANRICHTYCSPLPAVACDDLHFGCRDALVPDFESRLLQDEVPDIVDISIRLELPLQTHSHYRKSGMRGRFAPIMPTGARCEVRVMAVRTLTLALLRNFRSANLVHMDWHTQRQKRVSTHSSSSKKGSNCPLHLVELEERSLHEILRDAVAVDHLLQSPLQRGAERGPAVHRIMLRLVGTIAHVDLK